VAVSFIGGGNRGTRRKPPTGLMSPMLYYFLKKKKRDYISNIKGEIGSDDYVNCLYHFVYNQIQIRCGTVVAEIVW
jgi:hypothetical protein